MTDHNPSASSEIFESNSSTDPAAATGPAPPGSASTATGSIGENSATDGTPAIDVLHVEPDPRSAELLAAFAAHFTDGLSVRSVNGAEAALAAVDDTDCVVTEQRLPDGSGVGLVERLRRDGEDRPVVFHTTCHEEGIEARAFGVGADSYFEKRPVRGQYERILDRVRTLVAERDSRRSGPEESVSVDDSPGVRKPVRSEE
ncbi:response regulator [Halorubrum salsamenti]|uniref:response regulator n=1 Tax=Halorubrum salsamenti TaxID=2583990 RepID=UPI00119F73EE|nr:response regulator [Halorubrum salsamenti]